MCADHSRVSGRLPCMSLRADLSCAVCAGYVLTCRLCLVSVLSRAKRLHEDRQIEMQQALTQMSDRTEQLEQLAERRDAANKLKAEAEKRLAVS